MKLYQLFNTMYDDAPVYIVDSSTEIDEGIKAVRVWENSIVYTLELCDKTVKKIETMTASNGSAYLLVIV